MQTASCNTTHIHIVLSSCIHNKAVSVKHLRNIFQMYRHWLKP